MLKKIPFFVMLLMFNFIFSQVGINTTSPNASLDIEATNPNLPSNKTGILIPRVDSFPVSNPGNNQNGMLIFLNNDACFYYWNNIQSNWIKLETNKNKHYVGEFYGGGIVAYTYQNGEHGLIVSLHDLSSGGTTWGDVTATTNALSTYDGALNTSTIMNTGSSSATQALGLCSNYNAGGFNDWYLPASWEFVSISNNVFVINKILENDGDPNTSGFVNPAKYWTSTEVQGASSNAYSFFLYANYMLFTAKNSNVPRVRAVRTF